MKIAILASASAGGAGIASFRVYEAISSNSSVSVDFLDIDLLGSVSVTVSPPVSATNNLFTNTHFTIDYASSCRMDVVNLLCKYDVLNIHWSTWLLSLSEIALLAQKGIKILFTLHDFNYITGGCHYPAGCTGYLDKCINCPQVNETQYTKLDVMRTLELKRNVFSYPNVHLSAPSQFIVDAAINSRIVPAERAHVLRNGYFPVEDYSGVNTGSDFSLLLVADSFNEKRKGLELAVDSILRAYKEVRSAGKNFQLHLVGGAEKEVTDRLGGCGLNCVLHGYVKEHERLANIFQDCDFMLTCSYVDNWPNILVEAGSYGCLPIVGPFWS